MADSGSGKSRIVKRKITDVSKPAKAAEDMAPKLVITRRPIITDGTEADAPQSGTAASAGEPTTAPALVADGKRPTIVPVTTIDSADSGGANSPGTSAEPVTRVSEQPVTTPAAPSPRPAIARASPPITRPVVTPNVVSTTPEAEPKSTDLEPDESADEAAPKPAESRASTMAAATRKALEEANAAAKREEQLNAYVENKQFFVPINAVARKRSIKSSMVMTFIVFLLGLVLINLLLDTGMILLIQKIPHTNFF